MQTTETHTNRKQQETTRTNTNQQETTQTNRKQHKPTGNNTNQQETTQTNRKQHKPTGNNTKATAKQKQTNRKQHKSYRQTKNSKYDLYDCFPLETHSKAAVGSCVILNHKHQTASREENHFKYTSLLYLLSN